MQTNKIVITTNKNNTVRTAYWLFYCNAPIK